ncbi:MAG: flagellar protein FlgN [Lachnospiraceae bacterium]|nr:flagellar protein FlgN [Lachnospiraceae bacterium]
MENLIQVLEDEQVQYAGLLELSTKKTDYIVAGDLENINKITDEEDLWLSNINRLEKKRTEVTNDIANVLNKDVNTLKITNLVEMLAARPEEQKRLKDAGEGLSKVVKSLQQINERNRELLDHALQLVEFDMNLITAMRTAPTTANYNKGAYNTGSVIGTGNRGFDAKQ